MNRTRKPFIDFVAVKKAVTLEQILEHLGLLAGLKPYGNQGELRGCCPLHKGTTHDEFSVNPERNVWKCFGACKEDPSAKSGGNHLDFVSFPTGSDRPRRRPTHQRLVLL